MMKPRGGHVLATVLFTDIVDSSRLARELGDRRWRVLLARHHAIVRKALNHYRGREIDTAGDGFFAAFTDQVDAIRCACELSDGVRALGVEVRAGCHVGQAEVLGRKLGGVTVHAGARVMSEAGPGEVLVSEVMKELVPASGFTFVDRGMHALKGIDGQWRLYAVTAVDGKPRPAALQPEVAARLRDEIEPPPLVQRRVGRLGIAALALLIEVGVVVAVAHRPHPIEVRANSLIRIDPATDQIVADVAVADPVGALTFVPPHEVWVLSHQDQVISVVDATTYQVQSVGVFAGQATQVTSGFGIVYAARRVWVTAGNSEVAQLEPGTRTRARPPLRIPGGVNLLAEGYGKVWATIHDRELVVAIDPRKSQPVSRASIGFTPGGIGVGEGAVWASNTGSSTVSKINPTTGTTTKTFDVWVVKTEPSAPGPIVAALGSVWISDFAYGVVYRIDPATTRIQATIPFAGASTNYASGIGEIDGSIWVTSSNSKIVARIDPATNSVVDTIHLPYEPDGLAVGDGSVWVTITGAA